jgi:hypothetical protein
MNAFLASLMLIAAGEVAPPPVISNADTYYNLNPHEQAEWNSAMRVADAGITLVRRARSLLASRNIPDDQLSVEKSEEMVDPATVRMPVSRLGKFGGGSAGFAAPKPSPQDAVLALSDTPEQLKARAQKLADEGKAKIQQAMPSLERLRARAAARIAEKMKPVDFTVVATPAAWNVAVTQSVSRLQRQARDLGYSKVHFIGSISLLGDGRLSRPAEVSAEIRATWNKGGDRPLESAPSDGYAYVPGLDKSIPAIAKSLPVVTAPKQVAILWAEYYAVSADGNRGLFFLRLADTFTMRLVGSEVAYTEVGVLAAPAGACSASLRDDRSFLPRLAESGEWVLGFDRASHPVGSALLAHLSVTQTKLGVAAAPYVVIVAGGGPAGNDGVRAKWRAVAVTAPAGVTAFQVTSIPNGAEGVEVGQLTLKVGTPAATK